MMHFLLDGRAAVKRNMEVTMIARLFSRLFPRPATDKTHERETQELTTSLITMFANGNPTLKQGKYLTGRDVDKLRDQVLCYRF